MRNPQHNQSAAISDSRRLTNGSGNELTVFNYENKKVRTSINSEGEIMMVGKDLCEVLGINKYRDALASLDADERCPVVVDTLKGRQTFSGVNEAGMYRLIFQSRKAAARQITRWVTHEVLPSIRRKGYYIPNEVMPAGMFSGIQVVMADGKRGMPYTDVLRRLGLSTHSGSCKARRLRHPDGFFQILNRVCVTVDMANKMAADRDEHMRRIARQLELFTAAQAQIEGGSHE